MVQEPAKLSPKVVGQEFVRQYYTMLAKEPKYLHRFYGSHSEMMHGNKELDENQPAVGQVKIREKIKQLDFKDVYAKVAQLDAFMTIGAGIVIQVAGEISNNQEPLRRFMQTFVLGPQDHDGKAPGTSFYVHNDVFRYQDDIFCDAVEQQQQQPLEQAAGDAPPSYNEVDIPPQQLTQPEVEPVPEEPVVAAEPVPEPPVAQQPEPVVVEETPVEPEPVQQEIPEPVVEEVVEQMEKVEVTPAVPQQQQQPPQQQQQQQAVAPPVVEKQAPPPAQPKPTTPAAPLSWAARMRGQAGNAAQPQPTQAKAEQNGTPVDAPAADFPPVQNGQAAAQQQHHQPPQQQQQQHQQQQQREQQHQRENGKQENRYNNREERGGYQGRRDFHNDDKQQVFVGGLPYEMNESIMREVFSKFGSIKHVRITNRGNSGQGGNSAGFGFVTFTSEEGAQAALQSRESISYKGMQLNVEEKKTRGERDGARGGGGFRAQNGGYKPRENRSSRDYQNREGGGGNRGGPQGGRQSFGEGRRGGRQKF